jgi:hypothetical protein
VPRSRLASTHASHDLLNSVKPAGTLVRDTLTQIGMTSLGGGCGGSGGVQPLRGLEGRIWSLTLTLLCMSEDIERTIERGEFEELAKE